MNTELLYTVNKDLQYEMIFSPQVIQKIEELFDIDVSTEECLEFISKFGEQEFLDHFEDLIDFEYEFKFVNIQTLIDFYSGLSFLDLDFYGQFPSRREFIEMHYCLDDMDSVIIIDWNQTISQVSEIFDFIPSDDGFYVFCK
jgi:hypothetical protein